MILIDPELELSRVADALNAGSAKPLRLPSAQNLARSLAQFLKRAQAAARLRGQVTVLLTGDAAMRDLNHRFRGKNKTTDVLSFPASNLVPKKGKNQKESQEIGDVAISLETAQKQSVEQGHPLATEIKVLILHGLLHLAGYDHETDSGEMLRREQRLREELGLPSGLIERAKRNPGKATTGPSTRPGAPGLAQDDKAKGQRKKIRWTSSPSVSQNARKDGATAGRRVGDAPRGRKR